jgi:alpha-tubulin suppressor-like RCC1 family protein/Tfp pilus assembly protein PilE
MTSNKSRNLYAFTIVESLVVIVVVVIMSILVLASYRGISSGAKDVSALADLTNSANLLEAYKSKYGSYPTAIDSSNCPAAPTADSQLCFKASSSQESFDYQPGDNSYPQSFTLLAITGTTGVFYGINNGGPATKISGGWVSVANSTGNTCAIAFNGNAYCWGDNTYGQIGDNTSGTNRLVPTAVVRTGVLNGLTIKRITTGAGWTCAIASDKNAYCWGYNSAGMIGDNTSGTNRLVPTAVNRSGALSGLTVNQISAGQSSTCVIASDNNAYCWGSNNFGQIGDNTSGTNRLVPTAVYTAGVLSGLTIRQISIGAFSVCAIASDDNGYCWGDNTLGQHGDGTLGSNHLVPVAVDATGVLSGLTLKQISAGQNTTCALAFDKKVYCWGSNSAGQVGDNTTGTSRLTPTAVDTTGVLSGLTVKSITAKGLHTCAIASNNNAYCWGYNAYGQIGDNTSGTNRLVPTAVSKAGVLSNLTILSISNAGADTCAVASNNYMYCWGRNNLGQIGDNTTGTNRLVPTLVTNV